jgi:hypothetical protein
MNMAESVSACTVDTDRQGACLAALERGMGASLCGLQHQTIDKGPCKRPDHQWIIRSQLQALERRNFSGGAIRSAFITWIKIDS